MIKTFISKVSIPSIISSLILGYAVIEVQPANALRITTPSFFDGSATTINFETFPGSTSIIPDVTSLTNQYSSLGVLFSSEDSINTLQNTDSADSAGRFQAPFRILAALAGGGTPASGVRYAGGNVPGGFNVSDMRIDFITPVSAFGFVMIDNDFTNVRISAFNKVGTLLESIIAPRVGEGGRSYQGISIPNISYIIIDGQNDGILDSTFIDDLTFSPSASVPEPLTILGSVTALCFGAFFKRKLKSSESISKEIAIEV